MQYLKLDKTEFRKILTFNTLPLQELQWHPKMLIVDTHMPVI